MNPASTSTTLTTQSNEQPPVAPATIPPVPSTPEPISANSTPSGSGMGKKLAMIGGAVVVVLIALAVAGWFLLWSPQAQSKRVANAFMSDMASGNVDAAAALASDGSSADTKAFLQTASDGSKGSYSASQSTFKDNKRYALYNLTNDTHKYARVIVDKENGKWLVSSYVYGSTALALIPGSSTASSSPSTTSTTPATPATTSCLVKSDFYTIEQANNGGNGTSSVDYSQKQTDENAYYTAITYFLPDSLNFDTQNDIAGYTNDVLVTSFANFYKANSSKQFTIHLYGIVATTAASDLGFANQRAQKIASSLEAQGVPSDRIVIETPQNIATYNGGIWANQTSDPMAQRFARSVPINIIPDSSCF